jgi:hypothetical protein
MLSDDKTNALQSLLGGLPGHAALRLAQMVEIDRLQDGSLPHGLILDCLRPALRDNGDADRRPSPLRYFCLPFEDMLFSGARKEKRKGCISRSAVVPAWNWLSRSLIPNQVAAYVEEFKPFALAGDDAACERLAAGLWAVAGKAMREAFAADPDEARAFFASDFLAADAEEIALLLPAGLLLMEVRALFPAPAPAPGEEQLDAFREIYRRALEEAPDAVPYLPVVAMGRLEKPWQAVRLALLVTRRRSDTLVSSTNMGLVGDIMFARMEDACAGIRAMGQPDFDPDALIDRLTEFTLLSSALSREVDILRGGKWGKRLTSNRSAVGGAMESYMERAPREIASALPMKRSQGGIMPLVPDLSLDVGEEKVAVACRYAKLLAGSKYLAVAASFATSHKEAVKAAVDLLCFYNEALIKELQSGRGKSDEGLERRFQAAVALTRLLLSAEEAEFLRRRGEKSRAA